MTVGYKNRKEGAENKAERFIVTAAKLILGDVRYKEFDCHNYPSNYQIKSIQKGKEWLPQYLNLFLETLIKYPLKQSSTIWIGNRD